MVDETQNTYWLALKYLEHEYGKVFPMGPYFHVEDKVFYLQGARLYKLVPSYAYDHITPIIISLEKIFT